MDVNDESHATNPILFNCRFLISLLYRPVLCLLSGQKASVAVRCCPVLFEKRSTKKSSTGNNSNALYWNLFCCHCKIYSLLFNFDIDDDDSETEKNQDMFE